VTVAIKICGVTRSDDAAAIAPVADYIGLNLWPRSKRYIAPDRAASLAATIRAAGPAKIVGVFVDALPGEVAAIAEQVGLDIVQLHGPDHELGAMASAVRRPIWRALAASPGVALAGGTGIEAVLLDTPSAGRGGSGVTFDWSIAAAARHDHPTMRLVLAGGLTPDNVASAIAAVEPWGVDVASGVEFAPGVKDAARVAAFVAAVRG